MSLCQHIPLPTYASEDTFAASVLRELAPWFTYQREVPGTHCAGTGMRLDAVLAPREATNWKDNHPAFGVEFKLARPEWGAKDFTSWAAQAIDYTHVNWKGYGRLRIFACPSPVSYFQRSTGGMDAAFVMSRLLWQLGVGELTLLANDGWALLAQGEHILWSQTRGLHEARRWQIRPKTGSR